MGTFTAATTFWISARLFPSRNAASRSTKWMASAPASTNSWATATGSRSEEHTSELQSRGHLVCRLLLEKKKKNNTHQYTHQHNRPTDRTADGSRNRR